MRKLKKLCFLFVIGFIPLQMFAWQGMATPKLHISGRNLQDPSGKNVRLFGYMLPTSGAGSGGHFNNPTTFSTQECAPILDIRKKEAEFLTHTGSQFGKSHGWYNSFIRLWTPNDSWTDNGTYDAALQDRAWNNLYIPYIQYCKSVGLYVILIGNCPSGPNFMSAQHKSNLIKFWTRICNTYPAIKNADNVMFELINEPVAIESSLGNGDYGADGDDHYRAMQTYMTDICSAIRNTGADNIIWVPGLVWQAMLKPFATYPVNLSNIGYAGHWYPNGEDNATNIINSWNNDWKYCSDKYPIIVTEGSWNNMNPDQGLRRGDETFGNTLKSLFDNAGNVSWFCGMLEEVIGNISGDPSTWNLTGAIEGAKAAFEWWYTYASYAPGSGCTPTAITPYIQVNGGTWQQTSSVTVASGATVIFGPQPASGGSWRWSGCGTSGTSREQTIHPTGTCTATATYTNTGGCQSTQNITVTVSGSSSSSSSSSSGSITNGVYRITPRNGGKAVDVNGCGTADGTNVQNWSWQNNNCQKWQFTSLTGGYWRLSPMNATSKALDVSGVSTADGANVNIWAYGGGNNQQWQLVSVTGGYYQIVARHSGKCLDLAGGVTTDGTNIQQWNCSGSGTNGHFTLTRLSSAEDVLTESLTEYTLYPSPVDNNLHITFNGQEKVNVRIYNNLGALALSSDFTGDTKTLDVSKLTSGMYFIRLEGNERTITDRFIKK